MNGSGRRKRKKKVVNPQAIGEAIDNTEIARMTCLCSGGPHPSLLNIREEELWAILGELIIVVDPAYFLFTAIKFDNRMS